MFNFKFIKMRRIVRLVHHIIFWISLSTLIVYFNWANQNSSTLPGLPRPEIRTFWEVLNRYSDSIIILLLVSIPIFYLSLYIITPKFLFKRTPINYLRYIGLFTLYVLAVYLLFVQVIMRFTLYGFFGTPYEIKILVPIILMFGFGGTLYAYVEKSRKDKLDRLSLEKQNYELELNILKSTISPHFLFNTLNNIDVLITKDSEKASIYLKKLSDILRFMLYETKGELIPMSLELEYIEKYIELQKIRTSNVDFVNYTINGKADGLNIPPMIFIPFIENAFKHASNKKTIDAIKIQFEFSNDSIKFYCENFKNKSGAIIQKQSGLGINLIEQRLELLYKDRHTLTIKNTEDKYFISLIIN